jgi:acetyl-CoA C-acetyltransferase
MNKQRVYIIAATRTPIGSFGGSLSQFSASQLGGFAIAGALKQSGIAPQEIEEVFMGNVLSAGMGQAPATQAVVFAGLPPIPSTTINKVCASGTKAIQLAATAIASGERDVVIAGGMESMSRVPYYLDKARSGYRLGHGELTDGLVKDGLWDVYNNYHMGSAAELCASTHQISREAQDAYAIESYRRAQIAQQSNLFSQEITPVVVKDRKGQEIIIDQDEDIFNVQFEKIPGLRPVFDKNGTVTAANASTLNDGAAALILVSERKLKELGVEPLAMIRGYGDAQQAPEWFTTAPSEAIPIALKQAGISINEVEYFEINEAFSVVSLANNKLLNLEPSKVNVHGGAVAMGHPLGASGARIVVTLLHVLQHHQAKIGVAGICNGGGGASALVIERV